MNASSLRAIRAALNVRLDRLEKKLEQLPAEEEEEDRDARYEGEQEEQAALKSDREMLQGEISVLKKLLAMPVRRDTKIERGREVLQKVVHIYNLRNRDTIEDTVRSYFDQRLRYAAEALGKVTGEDAEELIASLNGQLEADEIAPDEIYKKALVEGTLNKQSKEEIRQAVERAQDTYQLATTSLFRDTSSYSFDSYQRELASPVGLKDLEEFTLKLLAKERRQVQRKDGYLEFLTPESLRSKDLPERFKMGTFDRPTAIRNSPAEFLAIGHPFVDAMLRYIGEYEFVEHTAGRVSRTPEVTSGKNSARQQVNF